MFRVVFSSGVQSHYVIHSDVRSHVLFRLAFRTIVHFRFSFQSHHSLVSVFKAILAVFLVSTFKAIIITPQFDVQSHHHFLVWRSDLRSRFRRSEPSSHLRSAFRAIVITSQYRCLESSSSHFRFWHSTSSSLPRLTFKVAFSVSAFRAIIDF